MSTLFVAMAVIGCCVIDGTVDRSAKFVINAEPVPAHANKKYPTQFRLLPDKDDSVGYIQLYKTRKDGFGVSENGKLEVVSYPKLEVREGAYGRTVGSWPIRGDWIIDNTESNSWIENRLNDNKVLKPKSFHTIKIVLSSWTAGIHNDVTIFATDYDRPEMLKRLGKVNESISNKWIIMDIDNGQKLIDYLDSGDIVAIAIETPDSS